MTDSDKNQQEMGSKKNLVSSAMVDLKAELHRKKNEFRRQRLLDHGVNARRGKSETSKKSSIWSQQNRGVAARASKDVSDMVEEEDDLLKSRRMLTHKSKLYDEMSSITSIPEDDGSEGFLVDFQKKAVDRIIEEREKKREKEENEREEKAEKQALAKPIPDAADSDEEWVDFTDNFGRSRRCMKKDLERVKERDKEFSITKSKESIKDDSKNQQYESEVPDLMSSDMHREKMRQKWEQEAQILLDKGQEDIHYSNVKFDEIRSHGVGFYQFSKDHELREEQLEKLKILRNQTVNETSYKERIQSKRKAMMEARLAKVRERRKLKDVPDTKIEDEKAETEADIAVQKTAEEERLKKEEAEREAAEVRKNHIREWDKDKQKNPFSGKGYVELRRNEREEEFAPPSIYFEKKITDASSSAKVSNESRINRLKQATSKPKQKSDNEFAPPSSYFEEEDKSHCQLNRGKHSPAFKNVFDSKSSCDSVIKGKASTSQKVQQESVASIPLPDNIAIHNLNHPRNSEQPDRPPSENEYIQFSSQHEGKMKRQPASVDQTDRLQQHHHHIQGFQYQTFQDQQQGGYQQSPQLPQQQQIQQRYPQQQYHQHYQLPQQPAPQIPGKRQSCDTNVDDTVKTKSKVPKTAIMDTRFMLTELEEREKLEVPISVVEAVPYVPGSFTAAKFPQSPQNPKVMSIDTKRPAHISGGPKLYTKQEQEEQQKDLDQIIESKQDDKREEEANQKLNDFLASIRTQSS